MNRLTLKMIHHYYGKFIYTYLSILMVFLLINKVNCDEKNPTESEKDVPLQKNSNFTFDFKVVLNDDLDSSIIPTLTKKLYENYPRVLNDLEVKEKFLTTIKVWNNEKNFYDVMENDIGRRFQGAGGYVTFNEIRVLYNNKLSQNVLHEFCHIVSMHVNPAIPNNPRWLWEAVAVYESGDFVDPKSLPYMISGNYPTIAELDSDFNLKDNKIYRLGYVLTEYIIQKWGKSSLVSLIRNNGNITNTFKVSISEFEKGWYSFIKEKYL